jgi:molecular chaperone DnaK
MYNAQNAQEGQAQPNTDFGGQQSLNEGNKQGDVTDVDFEEVK